MHEESLHRVIRDYLTGEELEETSYEEFRQALARLLVEERGYPKDSLTAKVGLCFPAQGREYTRLIDLLVKSQAGLPLMLVIFCSGEPGSYLREAVAAARLHCPPVPLALTTDTKTAELVACATGQSLGSGLRAIPYYQDLPDLAAKHPLAPLNPQQTDREQRILHTYSELLASCCPGTCRPKAKN